MGVERRYVATCASSPTRRKGEAIVLFFPMDWEVLFSSCFGSFGKKRVKGQVISTKLPVCDCPNCSVPSVNLLTCKKCASVAS